MPAMSDSLGRRPSCVICGTRSFRIVRDQYTKSSVVTVAELISDWLRKELRMYARPDLAVDADEGWSISERTPRGTPFLVMSLLGLRNPMISVGSLLLRFSLAAETGKVHPVGDPSFAFPQSSRAATDGVGGITTILTLAAMIVSRPQQHTHSNFSMILELKKDPPVR
jgi:hypothetical protein